MWIIRSISCIRLYGDKVDGDQVTIRGIYSDEANDECEKIMNHKSTFLNITGVNSKVVSKEVYNSLYELTKMMPNQKVVPIFDQQRLLNMKPEDITRGFLAEMFADTVDCTNGNSNQTKKSKYNTWDKFTIPAKYFYDKQAQIQTTVGRFIVNKFILQGAGIISATGFIDETFNKKIIEKTDNGVGRLYLENIIDRKSINEYTDRRDTLGYWTNAMLAHSISDKMLKPLPKIQKLKEDLVKKYKKELFEDHNLDTMVKVSDTLIDAAKQELKGDPGMDLYDSGDLNFGNNYRSNSIIKGAVQNQVTGQYDFVDTSFMDGIKIKDLPAHANSILASQYPASIATEDAGYMGKKLLALLQMMEIDTDEDSDCHTKVLVPLKITKDNKDNVVYSYIQEGGQLKMLDNDNVGNYVGKTVMLRSPMTCINKQICSKCAGKLFYLLGVKYAGLFSVQISHARLNLALKAKHNSVVAVYSMNVDDLIEDL